jgi:hypothetical protein
VKNRVVAVLLAFAIVVSFLPHAVFAQEESHDTKASSYLNMYTASLSSKGITGKLTLTYQVFATHDMDKVGVWGIFVRNNDGTIHQFIWGTTANGLLATNTFHHLGNYTLNLTSGNTYYCTVIFVAEDANGSDTRSITTQHVTCP